IQYRGLNCEFNIEWHSISSGGKPTFPTCEFPSLEWYPRVDSFFSQLRQRVGGRSLIHASQTHPLPRGGTDLMGPRLSNCERDQPAPRAARTLSLMGPHGLTDSQLEAGTGSTFLT